MYGIYRPRPGYRWGRLAWARTLICKPL